MGPGAKSITRCAKSMGYGAQKSGTFRRKLWESLSGNTARHSRKQRALPCRQHAFINSCCSASGKCQTPETSETSHSLSKYAFAPYFYEQCPKLVGPIPPPPKKKSDICPKLSGDSRPKLLCAEPHSIRISSIIQIQLQLQL